MCRVNGNPLPSAPSPRANCARSPTGSIVHCLGPRQTDLPSCGQSERVGFLGSSSLPSFAKSRYRYRISFMPPKSKPKTDAFAFVRGLFASKPSAPHEFKVEQRKADEEVLDRTASLNLAIAEHFAPLAVASHDPALVNLAIAASREARECVRTRKEVTGGGLAGGTQTHSTMTMRIEHALKDDKIPDDFHAMPTDEYDIPVQAGSSPSK